MSDDTAFLKAIKAAPDDDAPRLIYADWLDEQGRRGGEFLRVECELSAVNSTDDKRWALLAKLRLASVGLDEDWMAAVSRVSVQEINARVREIQSWLRRQLTVTELLSQMAEWDKPPSPSRSLLERVRGLFKRAPAAVSEARPEGPHVCSMREWIEANMWPGDELWEYDTGGDTWENLCGEMGYAIVRGGKVVDFAMFMMN
jgi:uncharacterized protein (TIGR02996 family)